jgi:hypothetical protein
MNFNQNPKYSSRIQRATNNKLLLFVMLALGISTSFAALTQKNEFYIDLPENWEEIPQIEIQNYINRLSRFSAGETIQCTYAFQSKSGRWFNEPFITVLVNNSGRASQQELKNVTKKSFEKLIKTKMTTYADEVEAESPAYDKDRNILWTTLKPSSGQATIISTATFLTKNGIISFSSGCSTQKRFEEFVQMVESIAIKPEFQYQKKLIEFIPFINKLNWKTLGSILTFVLIWFVVFRPEIKKSQQGNREVQEKADGKD